jgi:hypothetical protein
MSEDVKMFLPKIRTLQEAYAEIKLSDPQTTLSFYTFRNFVVSGAIPSRKTGKRYLINMADVERFFVNEVSEQIIPAKQGIRAVEM